MTYEPRTFSYTVILHGVGPQPSEVETQWLADTFAAAVSILAQQRGTEIFLHFMDTDTAMTPSNN